MDDARVSQCSIDEAMKQCAYILFYERCEEGSTDASNARQYWDQAVATGDPVVGLGSPRNPATSVPAAIGKTAATSNADSTGIKLELNIDNIDDSDSETSSVPAPRGLISRIFGTRKTKRRKELANANDSRGWFW